MDLAYHASLEQFSPSRLLTLSAIAANIGFSSIHCSDHFHPWNNNQGESGFAWSWLGGSMQAVPLHHGVVCAPGQRYHPAIIAQAAATLTEMYGARLWLSLGTGQALNESITGEPWPSRNLRANRLVESVDIMRRLWCGETVSHQGLVTVRNARLYTLPPEPVPVYGAAISEGSAKWVGTWADGLTTTADIPDRLTRKIEAFKNSGGNNKPILVKLDVSYAPSLEQAADLAHAQWWTNTFGSPIQSELDSPQAFELSSKHITLEHVSKTVFLFSQPEQLITRLQGCFISGATRVIIHNVGTNQEPFLSFWNERIFPILQLESRAPSLPVSLKS